MEISFDSEEIRNLCEDEAFAIGKLGAKVTSKLQSRLADIDAATSIKDIFVGSPKEFPISKTVTAYSINLCDNYQIILYANHLKLPLNESGMLDWSKVSRVKIFNIVSTQ